MNGLLLDTHVWLWVAQGAGQQLGRKARTGIEQARRERALYVSAISVWEIGMLAKKERIRLSLPVVEWIGRAAGRNGPRILPIDEAVALESTRLPGTPHGDPADRFLIATARLQQLVLVTADKAIRTYADRGYASVMAV